MATVTYPDFKKLDLRIGEIEKVETIPGADNLYKLTVNIGNETVQIVAGIAKGYRSDELVGKQIVMVVNLEPKVIKGVESKGMLLAAGESVTDVALLMPDKRVVPGTPVM